jgi:hypothetical protein
MGVSIHELNYVMPADRRLSYQVDAMTKTLTGIGMAFYSNSANKIFKLTTHTVVI